MSYTIGICGGSASGKSSFLYDLGDQLPAGSCTIVSQDHYYKSIEEQEVDPNGEVNFDLPSSIDRRMFHDDIVKLLAGEEIRKSEYTFNNAAKEAEIFVFKPAPIIIVEGLFIYHYAEISDLIDLKLFVEAEESIKLDRRLKRDLQERGYPNETVKYQWENHVLPAYQKYILPYRPHADIVILNNEHYKKGLDVISSFLKLKILAEKESAPQQ